MWWRVTGWFVWIQKMILNTGIKILEYWYSNDEVKLVFVLGPVVVQVVALWTADQKVWSSNLHWQLAFFFFFLSFIFFVRMSFNRSLEHGCPPVLHGAKNARVEKWFEYLAFSKLCINKVARNYFLVILAHISLPE